MSISIEKEKLLSTIDEKGLVELTQNLIKIPSITGSEEEIGKYLYNYLRELGFDAILEEVELNRSNVIARLKGSNAGPVILLNGHMDTVPPGTGWTKDPYGAEIENGLIYGRGSTDMKGGLALMIIVMRAFKESGVKFSGEIVFTGVVGEEENQLGTSHLIKSGIKADYALVTEPTDQLVSIAHKGALNCAITVKGKGAHASVPEKGCNAIYHASRIIIALEKYANNLNTRNIHPVLGSPTLVVGTIRGGQVPYMVADYCTFEIDRRFLPGETSTDILKDIQRIIDEQDKLHPEFKTSVEITVVAPAMETDSESEIVVRMREAVKAVLGKDSGVHGWPAVADANLLSKEGIPTVIFGPADLRIMAHQPDEALDIAQLKTSAKIVTSALYELLK